MKHLSNILKLCWRATLGILTFIVFSSNEVHAASDAPNDVTSIRCAYDPPTYEPLPRSQPPERMKDYTRVPLCGYIYHVPAQDYALGDAGDERTETANCARFRMHLKEFGKTYGPQLSADEIYVRYCERQFPLANWLKAYAGSLDEATFRRADRITTSFRYSGMLLWADGLQVNWPNTALLTLNPDGTLRYLVQCTSVYGMKANCDMYYAHTGFDVRISFPHWMLGQWQAIADASDRRIASYRIGPDLDYRQPEAGESSAPTQPLPVMSKPTPPEVIPSNQRNR